MRFKQQRVKLKKGVSSHADQASSMWRNPVNFSKIYRWGRSSNDAWIRTGTILNHPTTARALVIVMNTIIKQLSRKDI
ncbi:hypothetical protein COE25_21390 [Bacillus sp. AFS031507]|nr:hypothetical protein COE25_21390 [Bacillus sp. AFS031507]